MSSLSELQHALLSVILEDASPPNSLAWIAPGGALVAEQRASIYRSAYRIRLHQTLSNDFPQLSRYLGDAEFEKLTGRYIAQHKSAYTSLRYYADALPEFLKENQPYAEFPEIADLARFERALQDAFDAQDCPYLAADHLTTTAPQHWPIMRLNLHPSVKLLKLNTNAVAIWMALKQEQTPPKALGQSAIWLIGRGENRLTYFRSLSQQAEDLIQCLGTGQPLAAAIEYYLNDDLSSNQQLAKLQEELSMLLLDGVFSSAELNL